MKTILFVDDEPNVLDGMRRMLRSMRKEWQMEFADCGENALKLLAENPCAMIISDMRMPGMDGAELLKEVKARYPNMVRIILSGHSDVVKILDTVSIAHQFLAKPCEADKLKSLIERSFATQELVTDPDLKKLVAGMNCVPSLPQLYMEITKEIESADGSIQRVGEIIARDVAMSAKVLQLVNSAFFGLPRHVATPLEAATMLGMDVMRSLVLGSQIFSTFEQIQAVNFNLESLWRHCLQTSELAKHFAKEHNLPRKMQDYALIAGMLHDVGLLILAANMPERFTESVALARQNATPLYEAEQQVIGYNHAQIGAYLLGLWGLPNPVVEATAFHHSPGQFPGNEFSVLTATHIADVLDYTTLNRNSSGTCNFDLAYLERVGIADQIPKWIEHVKTHHHEAA